MRCQFRRTINLQFRKGIVRMLGLRLGVRSVIEMFKSPFLYHSKKQPLQSDLRVTADISEHGVDDPSNPGDSHERSCLRV